MRAKIWDVLEHTDWQLLAQQKLALLTAIQDAEEHCDNESKRLYDGLLNWIDAVQDAAHDVGYPVVWLSEPEENDDR